jgi:ABC-type bacteriocin/lantibiotic exporter with double-glycine peptidase domain
MMMQPIPFEPQHNTSTERRCGAASLVMIYRALNRGVNQNDIHRELGSNRTHKLASHAINNGLNAAVVRFHDANEALGKVELLLPETFVIINHQLEDNIRFGHFSVFIRTESEPFKSIILHDPQKGANQRIAIQKFVQLWNPTIPNPEVRGKIAVLINKQPCEQAVGTKQKCPNCNELLNIEPFKVIMPHVSSHYCPHCDKRLPAAGLTQ